MEPDGNCLFRSLSDQLFRDLGWNHEVVRQDVCDFIVGHQEEFKMFMVPDDTAASEVDDNYFDS
jgi:OTU-like cysteine protease